MVNDRPKSMAEINGKPFLEILLNNLKRFSFKRFILCTGYMADSIQAYFRDGSRWDMEIICSREERPLGTAGAVKNAEDKIRSNPFLVLNGDSFIQADLTELVAFHQRHRADISLLLTQISNGRRFGSVTLAQDFRIINYSEKDPGSPEGWINAGVYVISRQTMELIPPGRIFSMEHDLFETRRNELMIYGLPCQGRLIDLGLPESYQYLRDHYRDYFEDTLFKS